MPDFENKVAIVTGATTVEPGGLNIGGATATELAAGGALVALADINIAGAQALADQLNQRHGRQVAIAIETDVRHESQVKRLVDATVEQLGEPTIVINIAGIFPAEDGDVATMTVEAWDDVLAVNLRSVMLLSKHTLPYLRKAGGAIVNTASTHGSAGDTSLSGYGASKAGVIALTKFLATQYGREGVRCNAVSPGTTSSPPAQQLPEAIKNIFRRQNLNPEMPTPEQQAKVFAFLASDDAAGINGQEVKVDAGLLSHQPMVADMLALGATTV
ncbi:SDR family NAD(P)-dependent oxidoreductase [Gordonia terrae]|uniref:KR domain-containing protein n=2 Tax=Gordonia terrae TaxID=2055 RepID=A0AAD0KEW8_9ACTN|nr:SDR family oxidoreductase [Gordonia terrae]VTR10516.1 dehydrogenase [Clostridioides difficile]ANY24138.1 oxidoreductase [Gordonia terrae]AWO84881.1 KR domain-containing protein [Gordonia terrae]VTS57255.1 Levodione reductase [Gordonia terrae]GAB46150.1 putative oxidoreductase [Gordonia terrae NBRC 100016]